jgi:anaerobic ribonucleoside-triphosphate reductase activating protein
MLLHAFVPASRANGPGLRAVVYFQGCSLHCEKCWNPTTHKFRGVEVPVLEVVQRFEEASQFESLEGATFSGCPPQKCRPAVSTGPGRAASDPCEAHAAVFSRAYS